MARIADAEAVIDDEDKCRARVTQWRPVNSSQEERADAVRGQRAL